MTPAVPSGARARWLFTDTFVLTRRSVRHGLRHIDGLLMSVILPIMLMLLFVYVFGGAIEVGTDYLNYVVPGIIILTAGYGAAQTATSVNADLSTSAIDRFRSLPISIASLLTGHVLASLLRNLFSTFIVVVVALIMGFRPSGSPVAWLGALGIAVLFILAISWVAVAIGVLARSADAASGFTFAILFLPYISSAFVPPETLPAALRGFAEHQPVTPVIETMRGLLMDTPIGSSGWLAVAWCLGIIAIALPVSALLFQRRMRS